MSFNIFNRFTTKFKKKYGIEKMTLITLTDGGANGMREFTVVRKNDWEKE